MIAILFNLNKSLTKNILIYYKSITSSLLIPSAENPQLTDRFGFEMLRERTVFRLN